MGTATHGIPRQLQVRQRERKLHAVPSPLGSVGPGFALHSGHRSRIAAPCQKNAASCGGMTPLGTSLAWGKGVLSQRTQDARPERLPVLSCNRAQRTPVRFHGSTPPDQCGLVPGSLSPARACALLSTCAVGDVKTEASDVLLGKIPCLLNTNGSFRTAESAPSSPLHPPTSGQADYLLARTPSHACRPTFAVSTS